MKQQAPLVEREQTPQTVKMSGAGRVARIGELARRYSGWRGDRRGERWLLLGVLALGVVSVLALTVVSERGARGGATNQATLPRGVVAAQVRAYDLPVADAGLMQPAVDAQGAVWFGEMSRNMLGRLDPRTGKTTEWRPPNGQYNIMATAIDRRGMVWFTEQAANYIGRFDPTTQHFTTYQLDVVNGRIAGPQALAFDGAGMLWFTEVNSQRVGRLDPATGAITTWTIPTLAGATQTFPYSLAVTPDGAVWVGEIAGGALARLDPASGTLTLHQLPDASAQLFSLVADTQGRLWFTELEQGKLGMFDPQAGRFSEWAVPATLGKAGGLYAIAVSPRDGAVWFACASANALVRFALGGAGATGATGFTFYQLPTAASVPYGLAFDGKGVLWFTADGAPRNYIGALHG